MKRSMQAIRIRSAVAGLSRRKCPEILEDVRALKMASLMAKNADAPKNSGGSPIALDEYTALGLEAP